LSNPKADNIFLYERNQESTVFVIGFLRDVRLLAGIVEKQKQTKKTRKPKKPKRTGTHCGCPNGWLSFGVSVVTISLKLIVSSLRLPHYLQFAKNVVAYFWVSQSVERATVACAEKLPVLFVMQN
jgi:hypothetical protein